MNKKIPYHKSERAKARRKIYQQTPEFKTRAAAYSNRPEVKARINSPEHVAKRKEYQQRPEVKVKAKINREKKEVKKKAKVYCRIYGKAYKQRPKVKKKINMRQRERYHSDHRYRLISLLRRRLRQSFVEYSTRGKVKSSKKYGINYQLIFEHIGLKPNDGQEYHIDHIVPLCSFDFDDQEQVKLAFSPENHQWLIAEENLSKGSTIPNSIS